MLLAVAISPRATSPPVTEPRNMLARPVDSEIVDERAPCSVKCSVVTNVTAAGRGSVSAGPTFLLGSPFATAVLPLSRDRLIGCPPMIPAATGARKDRRAVGRRHPCSVSDAGGVMNSNKAIGLLPE
jgi:hypothetical protein